MLRLLGLGLVLTAGVALVLLIIWDASAALVGGLFGLLATLIHLAAFAALRRVWDAPIKQLAIGWGIGMALRLGGGVVWLVAVTRNPAVFVPLPTAIGFLGVLVPLLFTEIRFLR